MNGKGMSARLVHQKEMRQPPFRWRGLHLAEVQVVIPDEQLARGGGPLQSEGFVRAPLAGPGAC